MGTWELYTSTSTSLTSYEPSGYWSKAYEESSTSPQFMRSILDDFEKQHKKEDIKEPQTIFHFDPKGIVNGWPKKRNDDK